MSIQDQRPNDPLTASDAAQIMAELGNIKKSINERIDGISAEVQNIRSTVYTFTADLALSRDSRVSSEVSELKKERKILEQRIGIIDGKLEDKQHEKSVTDSQKMKAIAFTSLEERERLEKLEREKWWKDTLQQAGRTIIVTLSVSGVLGIVAFLWWLFQMYVNRGGP